MKRYVIGLLIVLATIPAIICHGEEKHDQQDRTKVTDALIQGDGADEEGHEETAHEHGTEDMKIQGADVTASFDEFPNLHPLVVHVPIMMLLLAALLQFLSFFVFKKAMSWIVLGFVGVGFLGAFAAAVLTHPHVSDLPEHIRKVYEEHEMYATWTLWLSGIAVLLKIVSHFAFHRKVWAELIVTAVLLASAYTVSMAGHHGSQLVFIEGVGPQGKYLETEGHDH